MKKLAAHLHKSGLLILDAHRNPWDILLTARHLHKRYQATVNMPIAGYVFHVPLMRSIVSWWQERYHIKLWPVYRRAELRASNPLMRLLCWFYPSSLTWSQRQIANQHFIDEANSKLQQAGQVVIVAPYGSPVWFGRNVRREVRQIMLNCSNLIVSQSKWSWQKGAFVTHLETMANERNQKKLEKKLRAKFQALATYFVLN